jgi:hypothetical protein
MRVRDIRNVLKHDHEVAIYDLGADIFEDGPLYFGSLYVQEAVEFFDRQIVTITVENFMGDGYWGYNIALWILPELDVEVDE